MALLTKEQINDILDITNVCFSSSSAKKLLEWNEKQTTIQFEVDWKDAPKHATKAQLRLYWVTESLGSELWSGSDLWDSVIIERPAPVITPHPHAALMTKYAEVAQRRRDPWVEFQVYSDPFSYWVTLEAPTFFDSVQRYRHIGDDK
jgi:hypothetical protein